MWLLGWTLPKFDRSLRFIKPVDFRSYFFYSHARPTRTDYYKKRLSPIPLLSLDRVHIWTPLSIPLQRNVFLFECCWDTLCRCLKRLRVDSPRFMAYLKRTVISSNMWKMPLSIRLQIVCSILVKTVPAPCPGITVCDVEFANIWTLFTYFFDIWPCGCCGTITFCLSTFGIETVRSILRSPFLTSWEVVFHSTCSLFKVSNTEGRH